MLLFEKYASELLTLHAILAFLTVALSTHLAVWLGRNYCRGRFAKRRAIVRFSVLSLVAYALTMVLGLALYPTYRVRVRAEFLENPSRIHRSTEVEMLARARALEQDRQARRYRSAGSKAPDLGAQVPKLSPDELRAAAEAKVQHAAKLVRWFDVKEHWALLGLLLSFVVCGILLQWKPDKSSKSIAKPVTALAFGAAGIAWAAALIGLATAAARSVAAL